MFVQVKWGVCAMSASPRARARLRQVSARSVQLVLAVWIVARRLGRSRRRGVVLAPVLRLLKSLGERGQLADGHVGRFGEQVAVEVHGHRRGGMPEDALHRFEAGTSTTCTPTSSARSAPPPTTPGPSPPTPTTTPTVALEPSGPPQHQRSPDSATPANTPTPPD